MKQSRRIIAVLLTMVMILSSMTVMVSAASSSTGYVYVRAVQDYEQVQQVLKALNKARKKKGLKTVKLDKSLTESAVRRAAESAIFIDSYHHRPDGRDCLTVNKKANRENFAAGYSTGKAVVSAWMKSSGHKANNLAKKVKSVGIAFITTGNNDTYCVLILSNSKASKVLKKSTGTKRYNIKVKAKSKYLKKSFFHIFSANIKDPYFDYYPGDYYDDTIAPGETVQMFVNYSSKYCGNPYYYTRLKPSAFTWSSSNTDIATITSSGKITGIKEGDVTIKAKMKTNPKYTIKALICIGEGSDYDW